MRRMLSPPKKRKKNNSVTRLKQQLVPKNKDAWIPHLHCITLGLYKIRGFSQTSMKEKHDFTDDVLKEMHCSDHSPAFQRLSANTDVSRDPAISPKYQHSKPCLSCRPLFGWYQDGSNFFDFVGWFMYLSKRYMTNWSVTVFFPSSLEFNDRKRPVYEVSNCFAEETLEVTMYAVAHLHLEEAHSGKKQDKRKQRTEGQREYCSFTILNTKMQTVCHLLDGSQLTTVSINAPIFSCSSLFKH